MGTQDGTQVTITPSASAGADNNNAPFTITLNRLQTYAFTSRYPGTDISGTLVTSTQPVALYGGAITAQIPDVNSVGGGHVVEQMPPTGTWGRHFLTVPFATRINGDTFRVMARDAGTTVAVDGNIVATLGRAQFYQTLLSSTADHSITTSGPALVAQYSNSTGYDRDYYLRDNNVNSSMMLISPTEQFQTSYTVSAVPPDNLRPSPDLPYPFDLFTSYITMVFRGADDLLCRLDGGGIGSQAQAIIPIGSTGYFSYQAPVSSGSHTLSCPSGLGVSVNGFYDLHSPTNVYAKAYSYPGGLGLKYIAAPRCDVNGDHQIDIRDINLIFAARNTPAAGNEDQMDADADLQITAADARICHQRCTFPACAIQ